MISQSRRCPVSSLIVAGLVLATGAGASGAVINVPADSASIQLAILLSGPGDEIVVAPGTYNEKIDFMGRAVTLRSSGGPLVTTLDATGLDDAVVKCKNAEGPDTVLEGFTITGGTGDTSLFLELGGGMFNSTTDPTVRDCIFTGNSAVLGGGMYNFFGASPTVVNCTFDGNVAEVSAGGLGAQSNSTIQVVNCSFIDNVAGDSGGAIFLSETFALVANCVFAGNQAEYGGAVFNSDSEDPVFVNCTFYDNTATIDGGALYDGVSDPEDITLTSRSTLVNCIVWGNAPDQMDGIYTLPVVTSSDVQGGFAGTGNINVDPLFEGAASGDLRLGIGSPCQNAGNTAALPPDTGDVDMDGNTAETLPLDRDFAARVVGAAVDMGAYERQSDFPVINGEDAGDQTGRAVAGLGDLDDDGVEDFAVGSPGWNGSTGRVEVFSGADGSVIWDESGVGAGDEFGRAIARSGDIDDDGKDDLIIGAPFNDHAVGADAGRVYVYSGATGVRLYSKRGKEGGDRFGWSVAGGVDVNGDQADDVIVGGPFNNDRGDEAGIVDVLSGPTGSLLKRKKGQFAGDRFGWSVAGIGNMNGVGPDEFMVGAPLNDDRGNDAGKVYVYSGGTYATLYARRGQGAGDQYGTAVAGLDDLTGDGLADFVISAPFRASGQGPEAGRIYVYRGIDKTLLYTKAGNGGSQFGIALASAGDVDCDGFDDILAGAALQDGAGGTDTGLVRVISGVDGAVLEGINGSTPGGELGRAVSGLGDLDGDGSLEFVIGSPQAGAAGEGTAFVIGSTVVCDP